MILCLYPIFETFDGALSRWLRRAIRELYTALCVSIIHYNIWYYYGLKIKLLTVAFTLHFAGQTFVGLFTARSYHLYHAGLLSFQPAILISKQQQTVLGSRLRKHHYVCHQNRSPNFLDGLCHTACHVICQISPRHSKGSWEGEFSDWN